VTDPAAVAAALDAVRRRIESAKGDPAAVRVVAVTKGFGSDAVAAAVAAGCADLGENYAQELVAKAAAMVAPPGADTPRWHFLGRVQRNKVARLAPLVDCWQSLSRAVEGAAIARHRPGARVLVEVETTGDAGRNGCAPAEVPGLVRELAALGLSVEGLMTVAPAPGTGGANGAQRAFRTVRELADRLGLPERSMGMTDDLEAAVAEGTTMVRVGRALFGPRATGQVGGPPSVNPGPG
jgi:pyridoxal phosphate enzyme (YggS family)